MNDPSNVFARHRGPYTLQGERPTGKRLRLKSVILARNVEPDDVYDLSQAFMSDPRDTIQPSVAVWSEREQLFVTVIRLEAQQ